MAWFHDLSSPAHGRESVQSCPMVLSDSGGWPMAGGDFRISWVCRVSAQGTLDQSCDGRDWPWRQPLPGWEKRRALRHLRLVQWQTFLEALSFQEGREGG
jgi:hypothetical protein